MSVYDDIRAERERAHEKHRETSMEVQPPDALLRLAILMEEVGEVAEEFNEARHRGGPVDLAALRKELIQVGAMAASWADSCAGALPTEPPEALRVRLRAAQDRIGVLEAALLPFAEHGNSFSEEPDCGCDDEDYLGWRNIQVGHFRRAGEAMGFRTRPSGAQAGKNDVAGYLKDVE